MKSCYVFNFIKMFGKEFLLKYLCRRGGKNIVSVSRDFKPLYSILVNATFDAIRLLIKYQKTNS